MGSVENNIFYVSFFYVLSYDIVRCVRRLVCRYSVKRIPHYVCTSRRQIGAIAVTRRTDNAEARSNKCKKKLLIVERPPKYNSHYGLPNFEIVSDDSPM